MNRTWLWFALAGLSAASAATAPGPGGKRVIEPFDYRGVTLNAGPLKARVDEVREFYLAIPDGDLLKGFRTRAGHPHGFGVLKGSGGL